MNQDYGYSYNSELSFRDYLSKTFLLVAVGLAVSTGVAFLISTNIYPFLMTIGSFGFLICAIAEIVLVVYFTRKLMDMSKGAAYLCFFVYSILNGINLSVIFAVYTYSSIVYALGMTTVLFICMSIIGHSTSIDLTKFSSYFFIGLIVIIAASLLNLLIKSSTIEWLICCLGIVIFLGLIAFDMQKLRQLYNQTFSNSELSGKMMIYGALELYLDFINLFIRVLSIFGRRKD